MIFDWDQRRRMGTCTVFLRSHICRLLLEALVNRNTVSRVQELYTTLHSKTRDCREGSWEWKEQIDTNI